MVQMEAMKTEMSSQNQDEPVFGEVLHIFSRHGVAGLLDWQQNGVAVLVGMAR